MDGENSITVRVYVGCIQNPCEPVTLQCKASDSIIDIKTRVCQEQPRLGDPEIGIMRCSAGHELEDSQTLESLFNPGCAEFKISLYFLSRTGTKIKQEPEKKGINWLPICKCVRFRVEAHEENLCIEDDYMPRPVLIEKRPKTIHGPLPFAQLSDLGIHGQYDLLDSEKRSIPISSIRNATSIQTAARVILLAPTREILKYLVNLNSKSEFLLVCVSWDKLSYIFLKKLRTSYPDIPIVAVTELNPHHLDLLTFLDTPLEDLPCCYGWDLSRDFEDVAATKIDFVNIRWLGMRPVDCDGLLSLDCYAPSPDEVTPSPHEVTPPPGFHEVIRMLVANPFLRRKKAWLAALDWLKVFGKPVSFHPLSPTPAPGDCHLHLRDDFIAKKLAKKDWV